MAYCNSTCQQAAWRIGHKEECRRLRDSFLSSAASSASRRNSGAEVGVTNSTAASDELQAAATSPFQAASICVSYTHGMVVDTDGQVRRGSSSENDKFQHGFPRVPSWRDFPPAWNSSINLNVPESDRRWRRSFVHMPKVGEPAWGAAVACFGACEGGS